MTSTSSAPRLVLATRNEHKVRELREILGDAIPSFKPEWLVSATAFDSAEPVEDGDSFAANSLLKARAIVQDTGLAAIADDSGICVDIMGGAPGIFSARWCGHHGDDQANLNLLLQQLADVPASRRQAEFVSAACLVLPDGREFVEMGTMRGHLTYEPYGGGGFGYDPIFVPEGYEVTAAQLSAEEKNKISHRGRAFRALSATIRDTVFG